MPNNQYQAIIWMTGVNATLAAINLLVIVLRAIGDY